MGHIAHDVAPRKSSVLQALVPDIHLWEQPDIHSREQPGTAMPDMSWCQSCRLPDHACPGMHVSGIPQHRIQHAASHQIHKFALSRYRFCLPFDMPAADRDTPCIMI